MGWDGRKRRLFRCDRRQYHQTNGRTEICCIAGRGAASKQSLFQRHFSHLCCRFVFFFSSLPSCGFFFFFFLFARRARRCRREASLRAMAGERLAVGFRVLVLFFFFDFFVVVVVVVGGG
ncbi:hypothetical protein BC567DRAFT_334 [Phyllosticta citribraziliensis]